MIVFQSPVQLLVLGAFLVSPGSFQPSPCNVVQDAAKYGSYKLSVEPHYYKPGAIYIISISGIENGTSVILQAVPSKGSIWETENQIVTCYDSEKLVHGNVSGSSIQTRWTSPSDTNLASAQIRAFVSFANGTTLLQTHNLLKEATMAMVTSPPTATDSHKPTLHNATLGHHNLASSHQWSKGPNSSVSMAHSSHFLLATLQLFSVSLGYKLLS